MELCNLDESCDPETLNLKVKEDDGELRIQKHAKRFGKVASKMDHEGVSSKPSDYEPLQKKICISDVEYEISGSKDENELLHSDFSRVGVSNNESYQGEEALSLGEKILPRAPPPTPNNIIDDHHTTTEIHNLSICNANILKENSTMPSPSCGSKVGICGVHGKVIYSSDKIVNSEVDIPKQKYNMSIHGGDVKIENFSKTLLSVEPTTSQHKAENYSATSSICSSPSQFLEEQEVYKEEIINLPSATATGDGNGISNSSVSSANSSMISSVASTPLPPAPPCTPVYYEPSSNLNNVHRVESRGNSAEKKRSENEQIESLISPKTTCQDMATPLPNKSSEHNELVTKEEEKEYNHTSPMATDTDTMTGIEYNANLAKQSKQISSGVGIIVDDFSDWQVGDRYELTRILGRGSYGEVAQARDLQHEGGDNTYVAIKRLKGALAFEQEVDAVRLFREMHILRMLRGHDCIIQLLEVIPPESEQLEEFKDLYLVFEYVDTDLYKLIMSPQYLTTEHIQTFLYQMLAGLKYIHSSSVIHRDLKPANILLNEDCSLKICDFGLARIVNHDALARTAEESRCRNASNNVNLPTKANRPMLTRQMTKHVVTRWYRAPELILIQPYTSAVDIWSLGCILAELLSMQEGSVPSYEDRVPLFPGGSCFPLSGEGDPNDDERRDQLTVIFRVIGTPSTEDLKSVGKANEYIKTLKKEPQQSLESLYPAADKSALDLLTRMLRFNPKRRCTAEEALEHSFLSGVRRRDMEKRATQLSCPSFLESNKISIVELKKQTYEEVMWYRRCKSSE